MDEQTPRWFKSSYSSYVGACVEASLATEAGWFKSTHSSPKTANCVEAAVSDRAGLHLRDSTHPDQTVLSFGAVEWMGFLWRVTAQVD
ncbi:DUF397 domain-containing protein [Nocardiopsis sp. NPDC049922]|uniref:DUF397 domain-containing protein n=1 Tax=Nocardiopsis sp. NPDC049922 TaxID=3155157 RepID=UPI0033C076EC